MFANGMPGW